MRVMGLDIGGANLKAAMPAAGFARSRPFALWRAPESMADELSQLLQAAPEWQVLAVTMTAELADCFATKAIGVAAIVSQTQRLGQAKFWSTDGEWLDAAAAVAEPLKVGASNWHALGTWLAREMASNALLMDIGTTTTDLIPLRDGRVAALGRTDLTRLAAGELIYTGVERTPLMAVVSATPWRNTGRLAPLAAEQFATMRDVYLLTGELPESPMDRETANGQPATRHHAQTRLARQLCGDDSEVTLRDVDQFAQHARSQHVRHIRQGIEAQVARHGVPPQVILAGRGAFLARAALEPWLASGAIQVVSLAEQIGEQASEGACAWAAAHL